MTPACFARSFARRLALTCAALTALGLVPTTASAANVLFVSDNTSELAIVGVLEGDGHEVTSRTNDFSFGMNPSFHDDLGEYDCIVWVANGDGMGSFPHVDTVAFGNLGDYVENGGRVFVTGWGAVQSGDDALLYQFLGATGGLGNLNGPLAIEALETSLTGDAFDIRGVTPQAYEFNYEGLTGLSSDTIALAEGSSFFGGSGAEWTLRGLGSGEIAFVAAGQSWSPGTSSRAWIIEGASSAGAYNAALRNFIAAAEGSASEPGAPLVRFTAPASADEGAPITISAMVTDEEGDTVTYSWDLDGDGTFGESLGEEMVTIAAGITDGPTPLRIGIEASDGTHVTQRTRTIRITNVAPEVLSTPPSIAAIGQHVRYRLAVADPGGAADPLTYVLSSGPPTAIVTPDGYFDWTPTESEVTADGTSTTITVQVDDGDMGTVRHTWQMRVLNDHAPSDPSPQFPTMGHATLETRPRLVVSDAVDIDGDALTYFFEIDHSSDFDSDDLQESGAIAETPVLTEWTPTDPLTVGTWYWRVWVSDGTATTVPVVATFVVVPDPSMIPDGGPRDGGVDASMVVDSPRGCSCTVTSPHGRTRSATGLAMLALGLVVALARRRRS